MNPETERLMKLADAYYDYFARQSGKAQHDLQAAIEDLVADRDTLSRWRDAAVDYGISLQRAIEAHCRGQKVPLAIAQQCPHHAGLLDSLLVMGVLDAPATSEPAKPTAVPAATAESEPTDLRTLVEGMKHRVDAAIGSLIGAARDKNLLTIDALRAIARVVEELAKEANP